MNLAPAVLLALSSLTLLACAAAPEPPSTSTPHNASTGAPDPKASIAAICRAKHVDSSSRIFAARDASGKLVRYSVTPTSRIADMGNLIFDAQGTLLGHDTGSEFAWDDPKLAATERARVAALLGGAKVQSGETPLRCP